MPQVIPSQSSKVARGKVLSRENMDELREAFSLFDLEKRGSIDARELKAAVRALGFDVDKEQIRRMLHDIGRESTDLVSFDDFLSIMKDRMQEKGSREDVARIFSLFDEEGTGKITFRTLKRIAVEVGEHVSDEELREMINEADRDGDGALSFDEFYRIMRRRGNDPLDQWDSDDE